MDENELNLVNLLGHCWNKYLKLEAIEPASRDDLNDFRRAIHDAQRIVMARVAKRELNEICKT